LEKIPVFGNILSAALDLMIMGGKMLTKTIQKNLPPLIGLIPLPFASLIGIMMAALFGFIMWPIIAIVSLSRQDFTAAVESFIRVIPPPFGDTIADLFLEGNRTVARLNQKRIALANDIATAFETISNAFGEVAQGATQLGEKTKEVAKQGVREVKTILNEPTAPTQAPVSTPPTTTAPGTPAPEPTPETTPSGTPAQTAGRRDRFSRRPRRKHKWRTQRRIN
jgi:methyl-accepting chemotaxis protein